MRFVGLDQETPAEKLQRLKSTKKKTRSTRRNSPYNKKQQPSPPPQIATKDYQKTPLNLQNYKITTTFQELLVPTITTKSQYKKNYHVAIFTSYVGNTIKDSDYSRYGIYYDLLHISGLVRNGDHMMIYYEIARIPSNNINFMHEHIPDSIATIIPSDKILIIIHYVIIIKDHIIQDIVILN